MNKRQVQISLIIIPIVGLLVVLAGSQHGQEIDGIPILAICIAYVFAINCLAFIPAYYFKTEKFFDLTGSICYTSVTIMALLFSNDIDIRSMLLAILVIIWSARLGLFLFNRIHKAGKDDRFDAIKPNFPRFFNVWMLQGLWITLTLAPVLIVITAAKREEIGLFAIIGAIVWLIGFSTEVIADYQKSQFRKDPKNKERFIQSGLWSRSRHPNYFGEIVLWIGITIIAIPVLEGWQWVGLISPLFVILLLTRISGVRMLEAKAEKKWGEQEAYKAYKANTPLLIPKL